MRGATAFGVRHRYVTPATLTGFASSSAIYDWPSIIFILHSLTRMCLWRAPQLEYRAPPLSPWLISPQAPHPHPPHPPPLPRLAPPPGAGSPGAATGSCQPYRRRTPGSSSPQRQRPPTFLSSPNPSLATRSSTAIQRKMRHKKETEMHAPATPLRKKK